MHSTLKRFAQRPKLDPKKVSKAVKRAKKLSPRCPYCKLKCGGACAEIGL